MPRSKQPTNALVMKGGVPHWELTADEICYPIEIKQGRELKKFYAHLSTYQPRELSNTLRKVMSGVKRRKNDLEILPSNRFAYAEMLNGHFVRMTTGVEKELSPEAQKDYLDGNPILKCKIVEDGYGGIGLKELDDVATTLDLTAEVGLGYVDTEQILYSPKTKTEENVEISHGLTEETETHFQRYEKATSRKVNIPTGNWTTRNDYGTLEALYNELASEATGYLVNGEKCTQANRKDWVKHVPLWHKLLVINEVFGEDRVKKT